MLRATVTVNDAANEPVSVFGPLEVILKPSLSLIPTALESNPFSTEPTARMIFHQNKVERLPSHIVLLDVPLADDADERRRQNVLVRYAMIPLLHSEFTSFQ